VALKKNKGGIIRTTMANTKEIPHFHQTIDFETLMHEARKHITALAGDLWTDHNPSDPGITQMEVLAFCIADLSYRTSFHVKDLIAGYKGGKALVHDLPLMNIALPNNPITIIDLRKVLIDMVHPNFKQTSQFPSIDQYETKLLIRNAFPMIADKAEVDFYAKSTIGRDTLLTFETTPKELYKGVDEKKSGTTEANLELYEKNKDNIIESPALYDRIQLNGLYKIQIEFEEDIHYDKLTQKHLRDLNQNFFQSIIELNSDAYEINVLMPYWDDIIWSIKDLNLSSGQTALNFAERFGYDYYIAVDKLNYDDYFYDYYAEVILGGYQLPLYVKVHFLDSLNEIKQGIPNAITINGQTLSFTANFLDWNELANGVNQNYDSGGNHQLNPNLQTPATGWVVTTNAVGIAGELPTFDIQAGFTFLKETIAEDLNGNTIHTYDRQKTIKLLTRITFDEGIEVTAANSNLIEAALSAKFPTLFSQKIELEKAIKTKISDVQASFYSKYLQKLNRVFDHLYGTNGVWPYLGKYRNLCEDFALFSASRVQEIALFGKINVAPGFNINELLAEIYFRIDQFLSPLVKFNALSTMLEKGYRFEELFNGPLLEHGFIENVDLNNLKRRSVVYTSDLIRIIMDVPGVLYVKDFSISGYIDNRLMGRNVENCLSLTNSEIYKPQFGYDKTKLEIWVEDELGSYDKVSLKSWFDQKKTHQKNEQLPSKTQLLNDEALIAIPSGKDRRIENYYSIQHDFPEVYGIGEYGLPLDADDERKSRAKQLKAFLLPFEQLLANYLKQVAHLPELFSFNRTIDRTYHHQPLYEVPDVQPLFAEISENPAAWQSFKQDLHNAYMTQVKAGESTAEFLNRRNRFLSQLLARFGESFEAYSRQMFDRHKTLLNDPIQGIANFRAAQSATLQKLINDKISFAEDFHAVSSERYKGFDTTVANRNGLNWHNMNIESYKLRLCRLLGIENVANAPIFMVTQSPQGNWLDQEGMHVVEHILLRPRHLNSQFLRLKNEALPNGQGTFIYNSEKDPYSFRITIVLPKDAGRFVDKSFRQFTEKLIRIETPAHIRVDFNWMSGQCGKNFEKHYSLWKQNIYQLKPWLFQGNPIKIDLSSDISVSDGPVKQPLSLENFPATAPTKKNALIDSKALSKKLSKPDSDETQVPIFVLQDNLVKALQTPCSLHLTAYNDKHQQFHPIEGKISFEYSTTDVFNLNVSEIGGVITCYTLDDSAKNWKELAKFSPIVKTYFNVNDFLGSAKGLTSNFGKCGFFKIKYELQPYDHVEILIEVSREKTKPFIVIKNTQSNAILEFDPTKDGVFRKSNLTWDPFVLLFYPVFPLNTCAPKPVDLKNEPSGVIRISSVLNGLQPTIIEPEKSQNGTYSLSLRGLYAKFGSGIYQITYTLDGLTTSIAIDLYQELAITFYNGKNKLIPNDAGIINVPASVKILDLFLELPSGELKVFEMKNSSLSDDSLSVLNHLHTANSVAYYQKAGHVAINREKESYYLNGEYYRFSYKLKDQLIEQILYFESLKLELPTIKLFQDKVEMVNKPFILKIDQKAPINYFLEFYPKDALVNGWVEQENGTVKLIESMTVSSDYQTERLELGEIYRDYGSVPILVNCANARGSADLAFTVILEKEVVAPTNLVVKNSATDKEVNPKSNTYDLIYNHKNQAQQFELYFNNGNGILQLKDEKEKLYVVEVGKNSIQFDGISPLTKGLATGTYKCFYKPKVGEELTFTLNVINLRPVFELKEVSVSKTTYQASAVPLFPVAQSYIWRLNGKYISRAKNPRITFDFEKTDSHTLELTMHLSDVSASEVMEINPKMLKT
jgi:hypothetical protein